MKTLKTLPTFQGRSNNNNSLKPMTTEEKNTLNALIEKAQNNGLKNFALIYNVNGNIYGFKTEIKNCLARVKTNKSGKNIMFKIFSPIANGQVKEMIENNKFTYYGKAEELEEIKSRHHLQNNGQAVEYLINKKEHSTIDHKKDLLNGGDSLFGDTEIKYFVIGNSSPSCRLFDNIK